MGLGMTDKNNNKETMYNDRMRFFSKWRWWHWLVVITMFGAFLRLIGFGVIPVSLYWDEMAVWNDALSIAQTGKDLFERSWWQPIFISYGDYKLPVFIWLVTLSSFLTKNELIAVRLPSLLAGISMIPAMFFLSNSLVIQAKKQLSPLAFVSAFVMAVLPWSLHFSKVGYEGHLGAAFLLWSLVCFFRASEGRRSSWLFGLSAFLGTLSVYSYFSVRFVWPVVIVAASVLFWKRFQPYWKQIACVLVFWVITLIPMYTADFYKESNAYRLSAANILSNPNRVHEVNLYRERAGNTLISRVVYNSETFLVRDLALQYLQYLHPDFLFLTGDPNMRHGTAQNGILWLSFLPLVLAGFIYLLREKLIIFVWLGIWWIVAILPAAVPLDVPHALRSLNALPVWVLIVSFGVMYFNEWLQSEKGNRMMKSLLVVVFSGLLLLEVIRYQVIFLTTYRVFSADEWQDGYTELARYTESIRDTYVFVYVDRFDDRFFLYYQPHSGMSYSEIQKLPSEGFKRDIYKNVRIRPIDDWETLENNSVIITTPNRLPEGWKVIQTFKDRQGKDRFVVVETPRV